MDTTIDRVKGIASHLSELDASTIDMYIDDAKLELENYDFNEKYEEKLQRYLAAHLATIDVRRVNSYSVDDISVSYNSTSKEGFESTEYGQEFMRLIKKSSKFFVKIL